jgi:hypothetical protein
MAALVLLNGLTNASNGSLKSGEISCENVADSLPLHAHHYIRNCVNLLKIPKTRLLLLQFHNIKIALKKKTFLEITIFFLLGW